MSHKNTKGLPWKLLLVFMIIASLLVGCGKSKDKEEAKTEVSNIDLGLKDTDVVAKYKDGEVTAKEFQNYLHFLGYLYPEDTSVKDTSLWPKILDSYIGQKIIVDRAAAKGTKIKEDEIENFYKLKKDQTTSTLAKGETYEDYLSKLGLKEDEVKEYLRQYSIINQYFLDANSEADLKKIYETNAANYTIASVRHILIDSSKHKDAEAKKMAQDLVDRIRKGEDFAKLADENTEDPGNTNSDGTKNGGLYADVPVGSWVEEFKQAALTLPLNQVSDPVKTQFGYHVMRVEKREVQPFDKVKEDVSFQAANQAYTNFMNDELPKLIVETHLPEKKE